MKKHDQYGFGIIGMVIVLVVVGVVAFAGWRVMSQNKPQNTASEQPAANSDSEQPVDWSFNEQSNEWFVRSGEAPECKNPFKFDYSPVDASDMMAVLLPGQYRGFNYKPHGGFIATTSNVEVRMPMDAKLVGLTRYLESPDKALQYVMDFESDCGIAFRFDHLHKLTAKSQAFADKTAPAKLDDTQSSPSGQPAPVAFKAGEVIATMVGHPDIKNYGFDFGVYDYRKRNEISKNPAWATLHQQYAALEWYGVCWFDMLPSADVGPVKALSKKIINPNKPNLVSDYCPGFKQTLEVNGGKPTDG